MSIAGELKLKLRVDAGQVTEVRVASTRPRAARLLAGKSVSAALPLLPLLFTACGGAQRLAGAAAVAAAQGRMHPATSAERLTLLCEATQEHLWRLLLDWPQLLGQAPLQAEFSLWFRRLGLAGKSGCWPDWGDAFADFVAAEVLGMRLEAWAQLTTFDPVVHGESLAARLWRALPEIPLAGQETWLPQASSATFAEALDGVWDEDFERTPEWRGAPAETGPLARWHDDPALVAALRHDGGVRPRLLARMMDLAQCARYIAVGADDAATPPIDACGVAPGVGVARVETARGTLLHRVRLEEERVAEYTLVAPTEWNFHPRGAFASGLLGAPAADVESLRRQAGALALALDPCVPYRIGIEHA